MEFIQALLTAIVNGFGVGIGSYFSTKHVTAKITTLEDKLRGLKNGSPNNQSRKE